MEAGEQVSITRHGRTVAVVVPPEAVRHTRAAAALAAAAELELTLEAARHLTPSNLPGLRPGRADELVALLRADRDAE